MGVGEGMSLVEPRSIDTLIDQLGERIDVLIQERDDLREEVVRLAAHAAERDEECVRVRQEMQRALEAANEEALRAERGGSEIEAKLRNLNERLIDLVKERRRG